MGIYPLLKVDYRLGGTDRTLTNHVLGVKTSPQKQKPQRERRGFKIQWWPQSWAFLLGYEFIW